MSDLNYMPQDLARKIVMTVMPKLDEWRIRSAQAFRNAVLSGDAFIVNPLLEITENAPIQFLIEMIAVTVNDGKMIDFGYVPNELFKIESVRSRDAFEAGELLYPYPDWLGICQWEGGCNGYQVTTHPDHPNKTLVLELYGVSVPGGPDCIILYDIITIDTRGPDETVVYPHYSLSAKMQTEQELKARGANSLDPLVTMLRLLADASVPIILHPAPEKLNRARAKVGKRPIPGHTEVRTKDYVGHWRATRTLGSRASGGGTHASPIAHWRRAHTRVLQSGRTVPVRSSHVNWRSSDEFRRLFYRLPSDPKKDGAQDDNT